MLLLLLLVHVASTLNVNTEKYSVLKGGSGEFGFSVAVAENHVFVSAPKADNKEGAVYHCDRNTLKGLSE